MIIFHFSNTTMQYFYRYKHIICLAYIEGFIFINKATTGLDNLQKKQQLLVTIRFYLPQAVVECVYSWSSLTWNYDLKERLHRQFNQWNRDFWWENIKTNHLTNWLSSWIQIQITPSIHYCLRVSIFRYVSFKAFK